jgi:hypothetical protein
LKHIPELLSLKIEFANVYQAVGNSCKERGENLGVLIVSANGDRRMRGVNQLRQYVGGKIDWAFNVQFSKRWLKHF